MWLCPRRSKYSIQLQGGILLKVISSYLHLAVTVLTWMCSPFSISTLHFPATTRFCTKRFKGSDERKLYVTIRHWFCLSSSGNLASTWCMLGMYISIKHDVISITNKEIFDSVRVWQGHWYCSQIQSMALNLLRAGFLMPATAEIFSLISLGLILQVLYNTWLFSSEHGSIFFPMDLWQYDVQCALHVSL
jgi:hypothetical protein